MVINKRRPGKRPNASKNAIATANGVAMSNAVSETWNYMPMICQRSGSPPNNNINACCVLSAIEPIAPFRYAINVSPHYWPKA